MSWASKARFWVMVLELGAKKSSHVTGALASDLFKAVSGKHMVW